MCMLTQSSPMTDLHMIQRAYLSDPIALLSISLMLITIKCEIINTNKAITTQKNNCKHLLVNKK